MRLKVACLQYAPRLGMVEANTARVRELLAGARDIDILVLPELALTGYNFPSRTSIAPFLEERDNGPLASLARELSRKFGCVTVIGYPERDTKTYNSAMVVDKEGKVIHNYRKTHLFETDETWGCTENQDKDFKLVSVQFSKGGHVKVVKMTVGICMDLNPYKFTAPFNAFEFALSCYKQNSDIVVVPTAWVSTKSPSLIEDPEKRHASTALFAKEFQESRHQLPKEPDTSTVRYWLLRLLPLLPHVVNELPPKKTRTTVLIGNRTGLEGSIVYAGSSTMFQLDSTQPKSAAMDLTNAGVLKLQSLGWAEEGVLQGEFDVE